MLLGPLPRRALALCQPVLDPDRAVSRELCHLGDAEGLTDLVDQGGGHCHQGRARDGQVVEHWGVPDRWDLAEDGSGDCEAFQLLKRKLLAQSGLPRRAMRMTVVIDEKGEGHAVLMLRTDRGDLILDNKTSAALPGQRTGYVFIKREAQGSGGWVSRGGATGPTTTANR